jgi:hypothetical protein
MAYKMQSTDALFVPGQGVGSAFTGTTPLPRSIASDGRRWVLAVHVLVHVLALAANIVACVYFLGDFAQSQMKTGAIVAVSMHGLGILSLLALAAAEQKQISFTVGLSFIISFLLSALLATVAMAVFTFRSDDALTEPHWLYYTSVYLQTLGFSMMLACSLNMAAKGDVAIDAAA